MASPSVQAVDAHWHCDGRPLVPGDVAAVGGVVVAGVSPAGLSAQLRAVDELAALGVRAGAAAGLHPWRVPTDAVQLRAALGALGAVLDRPDPRVVAVGETGLDRVRARTEADLNLQRDALEAHLALARALDLPVVLHVVRSHTETLASLKRVGLPNAGLQVHGFWGTTELVAAWGRVGAYLSIGRMVTRHPRARRAAAIAAIPGNRLLVETDASSQEASGTRHIATRDGRRRPADVWGVLRAVATIRGERAEDVALQTAENARRLFGLDRASLTPA